MHNTRVVNGEKATIESPNRASLRGGRARGRMPGAIALAFSLVALTGLARGLRVHNLWGSSDRLLAAEAAPPAPPAPPPQGYQPQFRDIVGINGGALRPDLMSAMKIGSIRMAVYWNIVEPQRGHWNWTATDQGIKGALAQHFEVVPMLAYTAPWATAGGADGFHPPQNPSDWTDFVETVVSHYTAAPYDLKYFQVWNEPTKAAGFWKGASDEQWVDVIYIPAAKIIRQHGARVVFGGWPNGALPQFDAELAYKNAWQWTDIIDVHYFGLNVIEQLYTKWVATGKCKGVWETEFGNVNNPLYVTNMYLGLFNWAKKSGNWTFADQYKLFWYPPLGNGCQVCLARFGPDGKTQVPTPNGLALEKVAQSTP